MRWNHFNIQIKFYTKKGGTSIFSVKKDYSARKYHQISFYSSKSNLTLGAFFVSFLILNSSALLFARRRLFSEARRASFVFCKCKIVLSQDHSNKSVKQNTQKINWNICTIPHYCADAVIHYHKLFFYKTIQWVA